MTRLPKTLPRIGHVDRLQCARHLLECACLFGQFRCFLHKVPEERHDLVALSILHAFVWVFGQVYWHRRNDSEHRYTAQVLIPPCVIARAGKSGMPRAEPSYNSRYLLVG